jgi:hypothetical protein
MTCILFDDIPKKTIEFTMPICTEHFFRKRDKDLRQSDLYIALLQVKEKFVLP